MQDANAAMQAHLVGIELLIRKDCLLITHLFLKEKKMHDAELVSSGKGIYELRGDMKPKGDDAAKLPEGLVTLELSAMAAKRPASTRFQK